MHISELETPVVVIDLDKVEANIARLQAYLDKHNIANVPHIKTHKIPAFAKQQMAAGAAAIACQKVSEAEVFADAGLSPIFIPYNILGEKKTARLMALAKRVELSVGVDSAETIQGLSQAAQKAAATLDVLVEFDTGTNRCGVPEPTQAADLARLVTDLAGLRFAGLMTYPYNEKTDAFVRQTRDLLAPDNIQIERVSSGGSPRMWNVHELSEVTEHRAGTYIYGDRNMLRAGVMTIDDCAMNIHATVVSRPTADRGILDTGSKTLTSDLLKLNGHGLILEYPDAVIYGLSEEHGHTDFSACATKPAIGERVTIIPNHCCVVSNLMNEVVGARNGEVEEIFTIAARGMIR